MLCYYAQSCLKHKVSNKWFPMQFYDISQNSCLIHSYLQVLQINVNALTRRCFNRKK